MSATSRQVRRRQVRTAKAKMFDGGHFAPPSPAVAPPKMWMEEVCHGCSSEKDRGRGLRGGLKNFGGKTGRPVSGTSTTFTAAKRFRSFKSPSLLGCIPSPPTPIRPSCLGSRQEPPSDPPPGGFALAARAFGRHRAVGRCLTSATSRRKRRNRNCPQAMSGGLPFRRVWSRQRSPCNLANASSIAPGHHAAFYLSNIRA